MIGTRKWIEKTSGDLSGLDRLRLMSIIVRLRLKARFQSALSLAMSPDHLDAAMPDSKLVKLAAEECRDCCSPAIYHHSFRTYFWADALAKLAAIRHDAEELAVASLLHDLELGKVQTRSNEHCNCFAGAGAATADRWLKSHQVGPHKREAITEAIALHLNPGVPLALGATPHLLNIGAMADVVGTRMDAIAEHHREQVLANHPRSDFKQEMKRLMQAEQQCAPKTRAGFLMTISFARLIENAPFES
ncbi:MAG: hypothetical protein ACKOQ8_01295 [Micrococcales bacterium]